MARKKINPHRSSPSPRKWTEIPQPPGRGGEHVCKGAESCDSLELSRSRQPSRPAIWAAFPLYSARLVSTDARGAFWLQEWRLGGGTRILNLSLSLTSNSTWRPPLSPKALSLFHKTKWVGLASQWGPFPTLTSDFSIIHYLKLFPSVFITRISPNDHENYQTENHQMTTPESNFSLLK